MSNNQLEDAIVSATNANGTLCPEYYIEIIITSLHRPADVISEILTYLWIRLASNHPIVQTSLENCLRFIFPVFRYSL